MPTSLRQARDGLEHASGRWVAFAMGPERPRHRIRYKSASCWLQNLSSFLWYIIKITYILHLGCQCATLPGQETAQSRPLNRSLHSWRGQSSRTVRLAMHEQRSQSNLSAQAMLLEGNLSKTPYIGLKPAVMHQNVPYVRRETYVFSLVRGWKRVRCPRFWHFPELPGNVWSIGLSPLSQNYLDRRIRIGVGCRFRSPTHWYYFLGVWYQRAARAIKTRRRLENPIDHYRYDWPGEDRLTSDGLLCDIMDRITKNVKRRLMGICSGRT